MESYQIEHLTFTYPNAAAPALNDISLSVHEGEFITLFGKSGCGKTTLLRQLKPAIAPFGTKNGSILFFGQPLTELEERTQSAEIGFVLQSPDNQIVTDKVWHELAFGLESLGLSTSEIRARTAEMASFFGIQTWFHKKVAELSGGQKQLLNLASVMVMQPSVLILDEPTSGLDPLMQREFFSILKERHEQGTTIFLSSHILSEIQRNCTRAAIIREGRIIACDSVEVLGRTNAKRIHIQGDLDLSSLSGIKDLKRSEHGMSFLFGGDINELIRALSGQDIHDLSIAEPDLEEIFMHYYVDGGEAK